MPSTKRMPVELSGRVYFSQFGAVSHWSHMDPSFRTLKGEAAAAAARAMVKREYMLDEDAEDVRVVMSRCLHRAYWVFYALCSLHIPRSTMTLKVSPDVTWTSSNPSNSDPSHTVGLSKGLANSHIPPTHAMLFLGGVLVDVVFLGLSADE